MTCHGIEDLNFNKLIGTTIATEKGHLDQEHKHLQSTKIFHKDEHEDFFPTKQDQKIHERYATIINAVDKNKCMATAKSYVDLTDAFPHTSSRGNKYLVVMYDALSRV